ncbi:NUDIX hydrolase domain-like protein [Cyathus striatus]|nr:NUDIX hydrolase domain-like protein [Cyathus striatus]
MGNIPETSLDCLSDSTKSCIRRLVDYFRSTKQHHSLEKYPSNRLAAVLVLLFEDQDGQLRVLLTTRSKALRTHAGQTALPGGRFDLGDKDLVETAYREAYEEVGLPRGAHNIYTLGSLEPFISLHKLIVTPVVAFLTRPEILNELKASEGEVSRIFNHPLNALLEPSISQSESLVQIGSDDWPYSNEYHNTTDSVVLMLGNTTYRMHRFRSSASPIKGLTSDILIKTAEIAYGRPPLYERYASDQLRDFHSIVTAVMNAN